MRILVVEDHRELADEVATGLRQQGMAVDVARDGLEALDKASATLYDVVVLDRDLPRVHGDDVCRELVTYTDAPRILMLTAAGGLGEVVEGLAIGADDYLSKPFHMTELVARVQTLARRTAVPSHRTVVGDLTIDPERHEVKRSGVVLKLTPKEFAVLEVLAAKPGRVVSAEHLLEKVWDELADPLTNTVRVTMVTLRRKLGGPALIETVKGAGYVLRESLEEQ